MVQRMGRVIGLKPDGVTHYKELHANPWPEVIQDLKDRNMHNFSIFLREPENLLFSYWEYTGTDFAGDIARTSKNPRIKEWLELTGALQAPLTSRGEDEWWSPMEEVFFAK